MKTEKIPTTAVLTLCSLLIACAGVGWAVVVVIGAPRNVSSWLMAAVAVFTGVLCATIVKVIGNIGQMMFDLNRFVINPNSEICNETRKIASVCEAMGESLRQLRQIAGDLKDTVAALDVDLKEAVSGMAQTVSRGNEDTRLRLDQIGCIAHDINQHMIDLKDVASALDANLKETVSVMAQTVSRGNEDARLRLDQISCDAKDVNQHMTDIKRFFEQVAKNLDLSK